MVIYHTSNRQSFNNQEVFILFYYNNYNLAVSSRSGQELSHTQLLLFSFFHFVYIFILFLLFIFELWIQFFRAR